MLSVISLWWGYCTVRFVVNDVNGSGNLEIINRGLDEFKSTTGLDFVETLYHCRIEMLSSSHLNWWST